jgi:hypothetical protein
MSWSQLPVGVFTGIDWAAPSATRGFDPYLVWAEAGAFAGFGGEVPTWLPLAMELKPGKAVSDLIGASSHQWLRVPPVYTSASAPAGLRFCTVRVKPAFFREIRAGGRLHGIVDRFELGLPASSTSDDPTGTGFAAMPANSLLRGKVVGLIDGGLAFASQNFLRSGRARTRYFWRQDREGVGAPPPGLGYGHELTGADINDAIQRHTFNGVVDEGRVYEEFDLPGLKKRASHGTHVLDLACGPRTLLAQVAGPDSPPSWAEAGDDASRADIVAVQIDHDTILDTSGGSMNVHILDGLMYILSRCAADTSVAVNVSWGTLAGPHDGTALLEAAMDQLIELRQGRLEIVLPVSNNYQGRTHANVTLRRNAQATLHWRGQPGDRSQNFLELWLPEDAEGIEIQLTPPGRPPLAPLRWGQSRMWTDSAGQPLCALIYPESVAIGRNGTCAVLATAPTFAFDEGVATAPSGPWTISLVNTQAGPVTIDAYVERDDEVIGIRTGARQSHFEDDLYDMDAKVDSPSNPTLIRRSGNFNSIATGSRIVSVGGVRINDGSWADYSPRKPDPDAGRPERPGVVKVPGKKAFSDENGALHGVRAAGTRSGSVVRLVGTSDAAPQQTRKIFNAM